MATETISKKPALLFVVYIEENRFDSVNTLNYYKNKFRTSKKTLLHSA